MAAQSGPVDPRQEGLVFREADRADDAALRRINAEVFAANPKTRPEITAWQWWDNPFGDTIAYVWEDDGEVVGQYVAYRMPATLDGQPGRVAIGVDVGIAETHRGRGLMRRLLDACFQRATDEGTPFYSLPNQQSVKGASNSGWVEVAQLEVRVLPTDAAAVAERLHLPGRAGTALAGVGQRLLHARVRPPAGISVDAVDDLTADDLAGDLDQLWDRVVAHHPWGVARHGDWWRWRYAEHPDRPYRILAARRGGDLVGAAAVITRDDLGGRFHCLLELVAVDEDAARALVGAVRDGAAGPPVDGIATTAVPGSRLSQLAGAAGLVKIPARALPRPVHFGVVPHPTIVPDPTAVSWSTAWGDLDHI